MSSTAQRPFSVPRNSSPPSFATLKSPSDSSASKVRQSARAISTTALPTTRSNPTSPHSTATVTRLGRWCVGKGFAEPNTFTRITWPLEPPPVTESESSPRARKSLTAFTKQTGARFELHSTASRVVVSQVVLAFAVFSRRPSTSMLAFAIFSKTKSHDFCENAFALSWVSTANAASSACVEKFEHASFSFCCFDLNSEPVPPSRHAELASASRHERHVRSPGTEVSVASDD